MLTIYSVDFLARARDHDRVNISLSRLHAAYPHCTTGELYDALITASYDELAAGDAIRAAVRNGEQVSVYLARMEA